MSDICFIGVDTSNYTTSVAILGADGKLYANLKKLLFVEEGARGLRQSDALFLHTKNLPEIFERAREVISENSLRPIAIGVSSRPRNQEGSYMPCFLSGRAVAYASAAMLDIPVYEFSHQCGHIAAAIYSADKESLFDVEKIGAFHISGGTTELLLARPIRGGFDADIVGGTLDLNAGQAIDRIGVKMGLRFPCGAEMERLASANTRKLPKPKLSMQGCSFNLSGLENKATQLFEESKDASYTSAFVFDFIGRSIVEASLSFAEKYGDMPIVYAGGVMSNSAIKAHIKKNISDPYFAEPSMSADNAVGVAVLTARAWKDKN